MDLGKKFDIKSGSSPAFRQIIIVNNSYGILGIISEAVHEIRDSENKILFKNEESIKGDRYNLFSGKLIYGNDYVGIINLDRILEDPKIFSIDKIEFSEMQDGGNNSTSKGGY